MATVVMTIFAQIGYFLHQQRFMPTSVWGMASGAVLFHRRMLPNPGSTFIRMTLVTELIDALGIDHVFGLGAMGVVAIGTLDLAFNDGMVRDLVGVGSDILMAAEANRGLFYGGTGRMNIMAGDTAHVILLVGAHIPQAKMD